jgi:prepilin-type N-terminal cleavage/methylation domain-containing protein
MPFRRIANLAAFAAAIGVDITLLWLWVHDAIGLKWLAWGRATAWRPWRWGRALRSRFAGGSSPAGEVSMSHRRTAFTLIELLVVIGIIVLIVTLAIPAFNIITGGRSIDSAQNQVSAILGRARADAVGLQEERGVFFYQETAGGRVTAAIVRARSDASGATFPSRSTSSPTASTSPCPTGSACRRSSTRAMSGMQRTSDGYLGHNNSIQVAQPYRRPGAGPP